MSIRKEDLRENPDISDEGTESLRGVSEAELRHAVEIVCYRLTAKFRFGYHDLEDMRQEAYILALEVLRSGKYDSNRPLTTFLYVHIHNRLYNFKRRHYARLTPPCARCPLSAFLAEPSGNAPHIPTGGCCSAFPELSCCSLYSAWETRNNAKRSLMAVSEGADVESSPKGESMETTEYLNYIEEMMPPQFYKTWQLARSGRRVNREAMKEMIEWINTNIPLTF